MGAYRLAETERLSPLFGKAGFYTHTLLELGDAFFAVMVSVAMLIGAITASTLSFAHLNSIAAYAAAAVLCLVCSFRRAVVAEFLTQLRGLSLWQYRMTAAVLLSAAIPLFFLTLKPIDEPDSANYLHFL